VSGPVDDPGPWDVPRGPPPVARFGYVFRAPAGSFPTGVSVLVPPPARRYERGRGMVLQRPAVFDADEALRQRLVHAIPPRPEDLLECARELARSMTQHSSRRFRSRVTRTVALVHAERARFPPPRLREPSSPGEATNWLGRQPDRRPKASARFLEKRDGAVPDAWSAATCHHSPCTANAETKDRPNPEEPS